MDILKTLGLTENNLGACYGKAHWLGSNLNDIITSFNPSSAEPIASVKACDHDSYEAVIEASTKAFQSWRSVPAPKRGELVRRIGDRLRSCKDALGSLVALEMGKSKGEGDGEVQEMIDIADFAVGQSRMLYGLTMHSERELHRMYEQWHPLGVTGVISAFNFPVAVWAWNAFITAICGNTVVWKPSIKTPLCAVAIQHICNDVMEEMGYDSIFSLIIPKDHGIAENFVADKRVPLISFTGSCKSGREVSKVVANRMGRSLLELGGNNAIIVDETADLQIAIPAIVFGAVGTAGQRCTTTRRLFVQENMVNEMCDKLVHAYQQLRVGDPLDTSNHMGPLIDQGAQGEFTATLNEARELGAEILFGGHVMDKSGYFVEPTIIRAQADWDIVKRETFAPILYIMPYDNFEEALQYQNGVAQGLSSALFSRDIHHCEQFLSCVGSDCGIANINIGTSGAEIGGAFGGEKETGGGREAGSDSWKAYMRRQTTTINWGKTLPLAQGIKFELES